MAELETLLARCEAAADFDRDLDRAIGFALDGWTLVDVPPHGTLIKDHEGNYFPDHPGSMYTSYTESIDAALALVTRLLPKWGHQVGRPIQTYVNGYYASVFKEGEYFHDWKPVANEIRPRDSYRPNGAIAVVIALLRTLIARRTETR